MLRSDAESELGRNIAARGEQPLEVDGASPDLG
jgi:hypothetical protein